MASRHFSLNMSEVGDVIDLLDGFAQHNNCEVTVQLAVVKGAKGPDLEITVGAVPKWTPFPEVQRSGLVSVSCSGMNLRTLRDALTHVLYALDLKLVLAEFDAKTKPT